MPASTPQPSKVNLLVDLLKVATRVATPMRDDVADPEEVSVTELRIILALGGEGALAGHDLAELMVMQPMNVSRALATLGKMGLVEASANGANRRRKPHRLSARGQEKFEAMSARMGHVSDFLFSALSKEEVAHLGPILAKLDLHLQEWQPPEGLKHVTRS